DLDERANEIGHRRIKTMPTEDMPDLMANDRQQLIIIYAVNDGAVEHDERLSVAIGIRIEDGILGDVNLGGIIHPQDAVRLHKQIPHARKLARSHFDTAGDILYVENPLPAMLNNQ